MRVTITNDPFTGFDEGKDWIRRGIWPCSWICCKGVGEPPFVAAYRKRFSIENDAIVRVHVSADERYELFLDGERIGRGSERGDRNNWYYETFDIPLSKGSHVFVARVWSLGRRAPFAQMTVYPGFIFAPEGEFMELLGTGIAEWEAKKLAHIVIALAFIGPLKDPVRNIWVIEWAMIACVLVIPLALICGPIREIPFYHQLIDCSFGVVGIVPLWICRRWILQLAKLSCDN